MANFLFGQICLRGALFANAMLLLSICLLPGCSAYPEARYYKTADREYLYKEGLLPFSLQGALVTIAVTADNEAVETTKALEPYGLTRSKRREIKAVQDLEGSHVFAISSDAFDSTYLMEPKDSFIVQSNISASYFDGTNRIRTIGTDFQDNRIKVIEAIGGTINSVLAVAAFSDSGDQNEDPLHIPLVLDFSNPTRFLEREVYSKWEKISGHTKWWYKYKISAPKGRAVLASEFFQLHKGAYTRDFPVSGCTNLTLDIGQGKNAQEAEEHRFSYVVVVPDPLYLQTLPFPRKGSIVTHSVCGADIISQPSLEADAFSIIESVSKQVESIWQAQRIKQGEHLSKPRQ